MSDDFEAVRDVLGARVTWADGSKTSGTEAHEALDRIEARLSTADKALKLIAGMRMSSPTHFQVAQAYARNALQPEHQKELVGIRATINGQEWMIHPDDATFVYNEAQPEHQKEPQP